MIINIPPHDFTPACNAMDAELIVTPELRHWAGAAVAALGAVGRCVPADLGQLHAGDTMPRYRWVWMLDEVQRPRAFGCPF